MAERSMHVIKGLPSDLLNSKIVDFRRVKTESETAFDISVLRGNVFSFTYEFTLTDSSITAINFYTQSVVAFRKISIYAETDVEAAILDGHAVGTELDAIVPENINLCSNKVTGSFARPILNAALSGNVKDLGVNNLESPTVFCSENTISIAFKRLVNGNSNTVRIAVIFEELDDLAALIGLKPSTPWLDADPWLDSESWND